MRCNQDGLNIIKDFEGCRLHSYQDGNDILTIGFGHTRDVQPNQWITQEQADILLGEDIDDTETQINKLLHKDLNDNQYSAIVSFTFNIGCGNLAHSTALSCINAGLFGQVPAALAMWNKVDGVVSNGLVRRRGAECILWNTPTT